MLSISYKQMKIPLISKFSHDNLRRSKSIRSFDGGSSQILEYLVIKHQITHFFESDALRLLNLFMNI